MYTFDEWLQKGAKHQACLNQWGKKLLELGVSWESFRRENKQETIDDLVQGGIPIVVARDIVTIASKEIERSSAPMAIFWDLENIHIPADINARDIVNRIKTKLAPHGHLVQFRGYASTGLNLIPPNKRSDLQRAGCHLVDCPHGGRKDVVDKMIIVDAMQFVYQQQDHATICFITGDVDYAYLLAVLQQNTKWSSIVISSRTVPSKLHENCQIKMIWETDIVEPIIGGAPKSLESQTAYAMVCKASPSVNTPVVRNTWNGTNNGPFNSKDRDLIRYAMLYLSMSSGTSKHLKSQVGITLQEIKPSRFPNRMAIKAFFKDAIDSGVVYEQGEGPFKMLTLAERDVIDKTTGSSDTPLIKVRMVPSLEKYSPVNPGTYHPWESPANICIYVDSRGKGPTPNLHVTSFGPSSTTKQQVYNLVGEYT